MKKFVTGFIVLILLFGGGIALNFILGGETGAPCSTSYLCKGYIIQGAECLNANGRAYCSKKCSSNSDCPMGWDCLGATKTTTKKGITKTQSVTMCTRTNWVCTTDADCGEGWLCKPAGDNVKACYAK